MQSVQGIGLECQIQQSSPHLQVGIQEITMQGSDINKLEETASQEKPNPLCGAGCARGGLGVQSVDKVVWDDRTLPRQPRR